MSTKTKDLDIEIKLHVYNEMPKESQTIYCLADILISYIYTKQLNIDLLIS